MAAGKIIFVFVVAVVWAQAFPADAEDNEELTVDDVDFAPQLAEAVESNLDTNSIQLQDSLSALPEVQDGVSDEASLDVVDQIEQPTTTLSRVTRGCKKKEHKCEKKCH